MDEFKVDEFFDKMKTGATKASDEAKKITKSFVKASSGVISQVKLKYAISETEDNIKSIFQSIGQFVYEQHKNDTEFPGDVGEKCDQIDSLYEEIAALKLKLADLKESVICPSCGSINKEDNSFCSHCGTKLEFNENEDTQF